MHIFAWSERPAAAGASDRSVAKETHAAGLALAQRRDTGTAEVTRAARPRERVRANPPPGPSMLSVATALATLCVQERLSRAFVVRKTVRVARPFVKSAEFPATRGTQFAETPASLEGGSLLDIAMDTDTGVCKGITGDKLNHIDAFKNLLELFGSLHQ